ncbi:MAG: DUF4249 family protein [Deferribacteres bacterium]|nr:DUF4249 family protein [candidate division KSB1 bacterium]MCB9510575.1 DUF4249 family protein [Deferribacteres bacterium]
MFERINKIIQFTTKMVLLSSIAIITSACGEGIVELDKSAYEPKIVIEGFLFPGQPVRNVRLTRNIQLNTEIDISTVVLSNAKAVIVDEQDREFALTYNNATFSYEYRGSDLSIEAGKSYTLEVVATVEGTPLQAKSTTTVPSGDFRVERGASRLAPMAYRERDENGDLKQFEIVFNRAENNGFYALALIALDADTSTFVYDNAFGEFTAEDVLEDFDEFRNRFTWIQDQPLEPGQSTLEIFWFDIWFYSNYQAVLYAGDRNFKDFLTTADQVQEIDGNFHEPALHIEGDGIGVFASAIADTVYFRVTQ